MDKYVLTYYGGTFPESEVEQASSARAWADWLDGLGSAVVDRGGPLTPAIMVNRDGSVREGYATGPNGYSVIEAEDLDAALEAVRRCPHLRAGGTVAVQEQVEM